MTNMVQRISQGFLSLITTFVLMAAPIAAIVYSSDSTLEQAASSASANYTVSWQAQAQGDAQEWAMQRDSVGGKKVAMVKKTGIDTYRQSIYNIPGGDLDAL